MAKRKKAPDAEKAHKDIRDKMSGEDFDRALAPYQRELAKLQQWVEAKGKRVCVVFEGRDAAGKDGAIKRILEHLPPRRARMVALAKPSDRDQASWYFQRYVPHLPINGELVLFNRSWYNRAGVEPVMGFCSSEQYEQFMREVVRFEEMLADAGMPVIKYYLDISKDVQAERLSARREDPLAWWKSSPLDAEAIPRWDSYTKHRDAMFRRTSHRDGPWLVARADDKRRARLAIIADLLSRHPYPGRDERLAEPDRALVFPFVEDALSDGRLAR